MERKRQMIRLILVLILAALLFAACGKKEEPAAPSGTYTQISQDEAAQMMKLDDGHVIVDVRRWDEYESGHIPGAICIPNESIGSAMPPELPYLDQIILIYCRSGNRSKQAAQKLADMGYTNIYEFGGILDWTGPAVEGNLPEGGYEMENTATVCVDIGGTQFTVGLEDNPSAQAFFSKLEEGVLEVELHDYGNFEKVGPLPWELPRSDEQITTEPGDLILYQGDQITIYYDENTWNFTRLGKIYFQDYETFRSALGDGNITVRFWLEWTE